MNDDFTKAMQKIFPRILEVPRQEEAWKEFDEIAKRIFIPRLRNMVARSDVEDVFQDFISRVFQQVSRNNAKNIANPFAWLNRILLSSVIDRRRHFLAARRPSIRLGVDVSTSQPDLHVCSPDEVVVISERVAQVVSKLNAEENRLFEALCSRPKTLTELASDMKLTVGTLSVRISRLKARIANAIGERSCAEIQGNPPKKTPKIQ